MSVTSEVTCPHCGAEEMHPTEDWLLIRAYKIFDSQGAWSQCLVCAGYYDAELNYSEERGEHTKGWFLS